MKIAPILNFNTIKPQKLFQNISFGTYYPQYLKEVMQDEFVKSNPDNIASETETNKEDKFAKAYEAYQVGEITQEELKEIIPNDFIKWAKETNFQEKGLREALKYENHINDGFEHSAYNIPGNDDYVLRIRRAFCDETDKFEYDRYVLKDTRDMELQGNVGQQVALFYDANPTDSGFHNTPGIEVLKKQKGFPNGNPSPAAIYHEDGKLREHSIPYEDSSRKHHFVKSMQALANMPDSSYDQLIDDILIAGEAGYKFDSKNSNNFLIDEENQKINIIDMETAEKPYKDRFGNTLYALVNLEFFDEYARSTSDYVPENPNEFNETFGNILTIIDKYTKAMKKKAQKFNTSSILFNRLLNSIVSDYWLRERLIDKKIDKLRDLDLLYEPNPQANNSFGKMSDEMDKRYSLLG